MISVFLCDNLTRIYLPDSRWAMDVRAKLVEQGHTLVDLGPAPEHDLRDEAEKQRVMQLLDSTGL